MTSQIALGAFAILCLTGAWTDLRHRLLPNWLCLLLLLSGAGLALVQDGWGVMGGHLLHAVIALAVGFALFAARIVGGGDAKFYAGVAAWFALGDAMRLLLSVSLGGLALFLTWFAYRRLTRKAISRPGGDDHGKFPYGTAIAAGGLIAAFQPVLQSSIG